MYKNVIFEIRKFWKVFPIEINTTYYWIDCQKAFEVEKIAEQKVIENNGDATIRTKYQIRTRDRFGPKTNSAQTFNYI